MATACAVCGAEIASMFLCHACYTDWLDGEGSVVDDGEPC